MKQIYLLILLLISQLSISQSTNDLDIKNGFRHFKFGSSPLSIKDIVKNESNPKGNPNITSYKYIGSKIDYVSYAKVKDITLMFFKNKLMGIGVNFEEFSQNDYDKVLSKLENSYGRKWVKPTYEENSNVINGAVWAGKAVILELFRYNDSYHPGHIYVYDKKLDKETYIDEF